jgi:hypothetical protein
MESFPKSIDHAVVFIHSAWSAVSGLGLSALDKVIPLTIGEETDIIIIDADCLHDGLRIGADVMWPQGNGEFYLVKNGKIVSQISSLNSAKPEEVILMMRAAFHEDEGQA